jgi:hypothetical protein
MALELAVDLHHLTWGELIRFVDAARPHVEPDAPVDVETDPQDTNWIPWQLKATLADVNGGVVVFERGAARAYRQAIEQVLDSDGDARGVMAELADLRSALGG